MYSVEESTNVTITITITKSREVRFLIRFLLLLHRKFTNATQVLLCNSNRWKLENMKKTNRIAPTCLIRAYKWHMPCNRAIKRPTTLLQRLICDCMHGGTMNNEEFKLTIHHLTYTFSCVSNSSHFFLLQFIVTLLNEDLELQP